MALSKLERGLLSVSAAVPALEYLMFRNTAPTTAARLSDTQEPLLNTALTPYLGNFPESFAVPALAGVAGDCLEAYGARKGSAALEIGGKYLPEISAVGISAYFALGETVLPAILPGTADPCDIPAVLISALAGYAVARLGRKACITQRIHDAVLELEKPAA